MKILPAQNNYVRLLPDEGKILLCKLTNSTHSEAIVRENEVVKFAETIIN